MGKRRSLLKRNKPEDRQLKHLLFDPLIKKGETHAERGTQQQPPPIVEVHQERDERSKKGKNDGQSPLAKPLGEKCTPRKHLPEKEEGTTQAKEKRRKGENCPEKLWEQFTKTSVVLSGGLRRCQRPSPGYHCKSSTTLLICDDRSRRSLRPTISGT